ncbi:hypothetical protein [Campylobacter sp. JMF_08 NE1]|uniref:hypothetical protein n=1 Tax=Campylobacter sp. JMF_08 NE1 TaxID=2983821 RepID=UPI0022E9B670|nr:hypothetical protein [Campylobacter sp. JMF_08 NE1]MDA3048640.1 hypothetical protein [Campylobacter sp. JMF_08 NE1]
MTKRDFLTKIPLFATACAIPLGANINDNAKNDSWEKFSFSVSKIYDSEKHCAFTSIVKFNNQYHIAFREAESHIFDKDGEARGGIRIITSKNGEKWEPLTFIKKDGYDLRDPKLSVTPDGRLMLLCGGSVYINKKRISMIPQISFSKNGIDFSDIRPLSLNFQNKTSYDWLWRVTWKDNVGYGVVYSLDSQRPVFRTASLVKTIDGINYEEVVNFNIPDCPGEATIRFLQDNRMVLVITYGLPNDGKHGFFGISNPPYTNWKFKSIGMKLGGPDLIVCDDMLILGTRSSFLPNSFKTLLLSGDINGNFKEKIFLPSGGDTSYPGFLIEGNELWCCYYSSHETKLASIYLAKIPLTALK